MRWRIADGYAESADLPGVRIPGAPFPGTIGLAPSKEDLARINAREQALIARGGFALGPSADDAVPADPGIASEALRTVPPRETAGNLDIKQLSKGVRLAIPVSERGALFSIGDAHAAQGDGEVCVSAIEMSSTTTVRLQVRQDMSLQEPQFQTPGVPLASGPAYVTTAHGPDLMQSTKQAIRYMIEHLVQAYGLSREDAYCLCSVAVDLKISEVVDAPNWIVSAFLPLEIVRN